MSEKVDITRKIYGKNSFENVVDTSFSQLVVTPSTVPENAAPTVEKFFSDYDLLFFDIPVSGSNSHTELVKRSSEYIGLSLADYQEEIRILREENVSLKNQLFTISQNK